MRDLAEAVILSDELEKQRSHQGPPRNQILFGLFHPLTRPRQVLVRAFLC